MNEHTTHVKVMEIGLKFVPTVKIKPNRKNRKNIINPEAAYRILLQSHALLYANDNELQFRRNRNNAI